VQRQSMIEKLNVWWWHMIEREDNVSLITLGKEFLFKGNKIIAIRDDNGYDLGRIL